MAWAILSKHKGFSFVAANDQDIDGVIGNRGAYENNHCGYKVEISETDFNSIRLYQKNVVSADENGVVLEDKNDVYENEEILKKEIQNKISWLKENRNRMCTESMKSRVDDMETVLLNIDTASISYPLNSSIETYLNQQGQTVLSDRQF